MKLVIIGAGRMGIRHAQGALGVEAVGKVTIVDIFQTALDNAKTTLQSSPNFSKCTFCLPDELGSETFDTGILASTADARDKSYQLLVSLGCQNILVEKPLGQSYHEVCAFNDVVLKSGRNCAVNLNMRLNENFIKIYEDLHSLPQLTGAKTITINTGSLGIGANGIHYLDLLFYWLNADTSKIAAAYIDDTAIPSGRGASFKDFGGWAVVDFFKNTEQVGTALLSMSANSTVFGSIEIVAPHGRIYVNEVEAKAVYTLRKPDSTMPVNRYFADYMPPSETQMSSPFLGDLTAIWLRGLLDNKQLLPLVSECLASHSLMFDWLNYSTQYKNHFPIT